MKSGTDKGKKGTLVQRADEVARYKVVLRQMTHGLSLLTDPASLETGLRVDDGSLPESSIGDS